MKYSRSAITQLTRWYKQVLIKCAILNAAIMTGTFGAPAVADATEINQNGVPFQTNTTIENNNPHIFNISTTTTNGAGDIGINTFGKFNVSEGDTANLNLINQQNKLVNLVFDSSASQIDGIVNSYKNGQIGGDVLFANPNGFVVGKTGVFNVGSLTMMTPTEDTMKKVFKDNAVVEDNLNALVSFNMGGTDYLLLGGEETEVELNPAEISIDGTINSGAGITIANGGTEININKDAKLNANMDFNVSGGNVSATKKTDVTPTSVTKTEKELSNGKTEVSLEYKLAMDGGNGVTIVSKNQKVDNDYLAAIVNLNGKVDANGGNVIAQTEIYNSGSRNVSDYNKDTQPKVAVSKVTVGGEVDGNDIALNARTIATNFNNDIANIDAEWLEWLETPANFIISDFVHKAKMKSSVEVLDSAKINATGDFSANANTSFVATARSIMENLAFNYTSVDIVTEAILRSGSEIKAKNLNVLSTTDVRLTTATQSTNIVEMAFDAFDKSFGHGGAYAVSIALADISNRAVIEKAVDLDILRNILVDAEMYRTYNGTTKNGLLPVIDKNFGTAGASAGIFIGNTTNEAIMDSSADITGTLDVEANYVGATNHTISGIAEAKGESSQAGIVGKIFMFMVDRGSLANTGTANERSYTRAKGSFDKVKVAAAVGVSVDNVTNNARIGDKENNVKPNIKAGNIVLKSDLLDNKSLLYATSTSNNAETSISGAVAVNIKNLTSDANAHGDFTIKGSTFEYVAQKDNETLLLQDGSKLIAAKEGDKLIQNYSAYVFTATKDDVIEKEVNGVKTTYIKLPNGAEVEGQVGDKVIVQIDGFNIEANTRVTHGMAYADWLPDLFDWVDGLFDTVSSKIKNPQVESIQSQDANEYLSATTKAKDIQDKVDGAGNLNILNAIDFSNLGIANFFNTFANASATAAAKESSTSAYSGAFAIAVHNTVAKAVLDDNSSILFKAGTAANNTLNISAYTNDQLWSGAALLGIINNITSGLGGTSARDGDSKGGALSFQWGSPETIANIGQNVTVATEEEKTRGDVIVKALDETDDINVAIANGAADESGLAGAISISAIDGGKVEAAVKSSNVTNAINGRDVIVNADKDLTHINANFGFTAAQDAKGIGISVNYADDEALAYIAGNVNAARNVIVDADYDKLFINGALNLGYAKSGTDTPRYGNISDEQRQMNMDEANKLLNKADMLQADNTKYFRFFRSMWNARNGNEALANSDYDFTRALNPDKQTASKAGMLSVSVSEAAVKAYIADEAHVVAGNDVKVEATSEDMLINGAVAMAIHGKSGMGGAFIGQWTQNEVEAYIGNAVVDALGNINVNAKEDLKLFAGSAGIAQGEDRSVAGNISLDLQSNTVTAAIKEGAKINTNTDNANQSVNVTAGVESRIIKGVGSVSIQAGGSDSGGAKGGTLDGDIALNKISAYIKGADVNAGKELSVKATNETNLITVDVAGAVSTSDSAYSGTLGAYVSINEEKAYIENSQINQIAGRENKNANINVVASSTFDDLAIVGTVAYGDGNSADASIRVDGIGDEINSYIKNSIVETNGNILLDNDSGYDYLAVTAAGAISKGENAISGAVAIAVNSAVQNSYIEGSTINSNKLTMDSDALFDSLSVTGVATLNLKGQSIGGSLYVGVIDNDINTYIKNSTITTQNDINMSSNMDIDSLSIIFAGSGGKGFAASGAASSVVNSADVNTYILSETDDRKVESQNGNINIKSKNDIDIETINGAVSISVNDSALGAAINTVVDNSDTTAGISGAKVEAKGDIDVTAEADEDIMSISVGFAASDGISASGSINTMVMASDTDAYITDSDVKSESSNVKVVASGTTDITGGTGSAGISLYNAALGASVVTGVIDNEVKAFTESSKIEALKDVLVSAIANETIGSTDAPFITVAGGFSQDVTVEGVIATMILSSTADAHIKGKKGEDGINASNDVLIAASGKDNIFAIDGAASVSTGSVGIGATVNTIIIDKDVEAYAEDTKIKATRNISASATETDNFFTTVVAGAGSGTFGGSGVVNTNVITSDLIAGYINSNLDAGSTIYSDAEATANMQTISGSLGVGGSAGVGLSAVNDIIKYTEESKASGVSAKFNELEIKANANSIYSFSTVSGAAGGTAGVAGVENVNLINNNVMAYATGNLEGNVATIEATDTVTFNNSYSGVLAGGGTAGVGATVEVNSVTSTIQAYIGGDIKVDDIVVHAKDKQNFDGIFVAGFSAAGTAAVSGTALANIVETTVKAYIEDNAKIYSDDEANSFTTGVSVVAENETALRAYIGAAAIGASAAGVGATVGVNKFKNTVEAYTGNNVEINSTDVVINAHSTNSLGKEDSKLLAIAGAAGLYAGVAGTVMYNSVEDKVAAYVGNNSTLKMAKDGSIDIEAIDTTHIFENIGSGGAGLVGLGASVGYSSINNTVLAYLGASSNIDAAGADISILAQSNEKVDGDATIVSGGVVALSGGVLYSTIGQKKDNALSNDLTDADKEILNTAKKQADEMVSNAGAKNSGANSAYNSAYGDALSKIENKVNDDSRIKTMDGAVDDLFAKSANSGSSITGSAEGRNGTTSAFIDTLSSVKADNLSINAENIDNVNLETSGYTGGAVSVGVSVAVSNDDTTTNSFISNNVVIDADILNLSANSQDTQNVNTIAAAGGTTFGGSGSAAIINSDKTTNTYVNEETLVKTKNGIDITTSSASNIDAIADAYAGSFTGAVGVSVARADSIGKTRIDIGDDVTLVGTGESIKDKNDNPFITEASINISTETNEDAYAKSTATTGGVVSGSGADSTATTGKDSTINIGKNFIVNANGDVALTSEAKNVSNADAQGRAYGGVSAGGATSYADIKQISGVKIADADVASSIMAKAFEASSTVNNKAEAITTAGAGAAVGISGSEAATDITSSNEGYIGKNYRITTTDGGYTVQTTTLSQYKGYIDGSAYGVVGAAIPFIRNHVDSTVDAESFADINSSKNLVVKAVNEINKASVSGYDLYGGAGGLVSGAGGSIKDTLTMNTTAKLGGNYAEVRGNFGNGRVDVSAYNIADISEKADLYAHGGIVGADTDSIVYLTANAKTEITNKEVSNYDDDINYVARNDVEIYTKSNVESYGGVAGTGGDSIAQSSKQHADVVISGNVKSKSGRNTSINALSNKSLTAHIYERTRGLASVISGDSYAYNNDSEASIDIQSGAQVKSYDAMNLTAWSSTQKLSATRDAIAYQLWGIPYKGKGNTHTENKNSSRITINGAVESGLGANRKLTINKDGYKADGVNVLGMLKVGEITSADIDTDIAIYQNSINNANAEYQDFVTEQDKLIAGYQKTITDNTIAKTTLENQNIEYQDSITILNAIVDINATDFAAKYADSAIGVIKNLVTALNDGNSEAITAAKTALNNAKPSSTVAQLNQKIKENNNTITTYNEAIALAGENKTAAENQKNIVENKHLNEITMLQAEIDKLEAQKQAGTTIDIYVMTVDNIKIHSGETNVNTGILSGSGSVTAPGNTFTITVDNNSVNAVQYGDLIIDRNLDGDIHINALDVSSVTKTIVNPNYNSKITITNHVDATDPTINFEGESGDIWLKGNVENVNGVVDITNYTGSILSEASITAKDLYMKAPNGELSQVYEPNEKNTGPIVAGGDINYAAKTININGLIQSGSEIKNIEIPEFSITLEDGKYYQIVGGEKTEMKPSEMTDGYYYLSLLDYTDTLNSIQKVKTYFKPQLDSDGNAVVDADGNIKGEIYLFKANIGGGNITLTGNIVSDSNNGKIVLVNGYGHIDVVNNSHYDLVTSALNADNKVQGVLTINDFKFASGADTTYDTITQESLTPEYLAEHAGTYTAQVGENGQIITTATNITEGNGSWGAISSSVRDDGANVYSTTYTPGTDAYMITEQGKTVSYQVYVERSWIVELFCGKKYETRYYYQSPKYGVKANAITVNFQGFDKPEINVASKSNIVMNSNISALTGDVNITSLNGSITTKSSGNVISANNIILNAKGNIGEEVIEGSVYRPIQIAIFDNGKLTAVSENDIYVNFPYTEISNINLNAGNGNGNVYLATAAGDFNSVAQNGTKKEVSIKADALDLHADYVGLDTTINENVDIDIKKLKARAKDDVTITNKGDVVVSSIVSENGGTVTIESKEGSIVAAADTGTYSDKHIHGGNIVLKAVNGAIATKENILKFASDGIFHVEAKDDIYLGSAGDIYVDLIKSSQGNVDLGSQRGIIASAITDEGRYYNIAGKDINLSAWGGSIENIALNADGTVNASTYASGLGDINIAQVSQTPLTEDSTQAEIDAFNVNAKDLKIGVIKAGNNVTLSSEKGIKQDYGYSDNADFGVTGERITLNANGDIGSENEAVNMKVNRTISAFNSKGNNIYLSANNADYGMKIVTIDTYNGNGSIGTVSLTSAGHILDNAEKSEEDITNIRADNIILNAKKNIGSLDDYMVVETTSEYANKGLTYKANEAYIKGVGDKLGITQGLNTGTAVILAEEDTKISANNIISAEDIEIFGDADINVNGITADNDEHSANIVVSGGADVSLSNAKATDVAVSGNNIVIANNITTDHLDVDSAGTMTLQNADVNKLTSNETNQAMTEVNAEGNVIVNNTVIHGDTNFVSSADTEISTLTVGGNFSDTSANTAVSGKLDVKCDANVDANGNIAIVDADINGNLTADAENIEIAELKLGGNIYATVDDLAVNTSNDLHIGSIRGNTADYTDVANITSSKDITNGLGVDDTNIVAKNINLTAGDSIGKNKALNIEFADSNYVNINASNIARLNNTGAVANYNDVTANDTVITAINDVNIANLNTDKLALITDSENVNITGDVRTKGTIETASKDIVIDNTSLAVYPDVTAQLYLTKKPMHLIVDGSNNIRTESRNVTRHDKNILVNKEAYTSSMEGEITLASENALRVLYHGKEVMSEADDSLYRLPTVSDYISSVIGSSDGDNPVSDFHNKLVNESNIMGIINQTKDDRLKGEKYSEDAKKKKVL
ncbi:MAG: filamentous hemagglutinin N-terminal domain-containing protein [Alphaproteobacteria bacterium]|nr:filamentous hemagglutinin N-terminal domain-containing protein [Alphaproteobacteria bacterium]